MAKRAYGLEDKAQRRRAILTAAADLFVAGSGELPPVARVAATAGLAKGTVYLYFRTKEAIFSALLLEGWGAVFDVLEDVFQSAAGSGPEKVAAFLSRFVGHVEQHPELLRLDALGYGLLMTNMEREALLAHKAAAYARMEASGAVLELALDLPAGRGAQLLSRTYGMTRGLWQSFDETRASGYDVAAKYGSGFPGELAQALAEYWRGALVRA